MALFEYRCPSYDYVLRMSWVEFLIRKYAFERSEKRKLYKIREMAYASLVGPHLDPKSIPSKKKFMPIDYDDSAIPESAIEAINRAKERYQKELKAKQ